MSIEIRQGKQWFRPMEVSLSLTVKNCMQTEDLIKALEKLGFLDEAEKLNNAYNEEKKNTKSHSEYGYIYDPDGHYVGE